MKTGILIIGAGPAGLAAARRLAGAGRENWLLVEREAVPGELSASFRDEAGFTWDLGGHVIHSHYEAFSQFVDETMRGDLLEHRRRAFIRIAGRWVPYPFQNNLHHLPEEVREECVAGMVAARESGADPSAAGDFSAWVDAAFGRGIAEHFMRPYNRKLWCCELSEMSASWVAGRVSLPDLDKLIANVKAGRDDDGYGANATFTFPKSGGTGELWRRLAESLPQEKLRFGAAASGLDAEKRLCRLADGSEIEYEHLVWTAPLTGLIGLAGLAELKEAAGKLAHNSAEILGLGLAGSPPESVREMCWMYFPEARCPFYRVTVFSNYSPENVPRPEETWSLMLEIARRPSWPSKPEELWSKVTKAARSEGLVPAEAGVVSRWHRALPFAYPLPTVGRDAALAEIVPALEKRSVYPRGRFGAWRYEVGNMDHCYMQGLEVVNRIIDGKPESVLAGSA